MNVNKAANKHIAALKAILVFIFFNTFILSCFSNLQNNLVKKTR